MPFLTTDDPAVRLVWRAIVERMEHLTGADETRRAILGANYIGRALGGRRR